jgi:Cu/Ag efflux protein CusF
VLAVAFGFTSAAAQDPAQKPAQDAGKAQMSSTPVTLTATIEAIDQTNRIVTLKGPKGNLAELYVPERYTRFSELKVGDEVKATYYDTLAVNVRKPGDPAPTAGVSGTTTPRPGGTGGTFAQQATVSVTVEAIDPAVPSVTVKGPKGDVMSFRVQDPKRLEGVKVGDTVDITYTRALLISVDPVKK